MMKKTMGFTLIELMIVVAIVGVLSAVAFPAFKNFKEKSTRNSNCKVALIEIAFAMEKYKKVNGTYPAVLATKIKYDLNPNGGDYVLALKESTARTYTLICSLSDSTVDEDCGELTYDNFGRKGSKSGNETVSKAIEACWR